MIAAIWARTGDRVIGVNGRIPWHYSGDLKRFKRVTMGAAVIMGRKTWESIRKPLPGRTNIVISRSWDAVPVGVDVRAYGIQSALDCAKETGRPDTWIIGGGDVYQAALPYLDMIDETLVPDEPYLVGDQEDEEVVRAPVLPSDQFDSSKLLLHEDDIRLHRRLYWRKGFVVPEKYWSGGTR